MVVNLFTNPDMVATAGEVVVWEQLHENQRAQDGVVDFDATGDATVSNPEGDYVQFDVTGTGPAGIQLIPQSKIEGGETYTVIARVWANRSFGAYPRVGDPMPLMTLPTEPTYMRWTAVASGLRFTGFLLSGSNHQAGDWIRVDRVMVAIGGDPGFPSSRPIFTADYSPDPDLTPQPRPGGGSQLVGTQVAGLTATGGVVVQSEQWAKSGGVSGRIINNTGEPVTVTIDDASVFTRLWTYDGAKETLATLASPSVIPGPATLGESKWVDLITSTAQRYDGPLFSGSTPNSADDSGYGWVYEWLGAPDASASMREFTQVNDTAVRVVVDLDAPAVGITVEGLSSVEASRIAIYRQTPGKERTLVQGLGNVDVDGAGYWVDYLPPLGVPVTYVVEVLEGDPLEDNEATITIPSSTAWLQDALNPLLAVEVACRPGNRDTLFFTAEAFTAFERPTNSDLVQIMGGRVPVGMTSRRQTPVGIPFNMVTTAAEASSLLREVLIEGTHLVLRVPPEISMLDPVTYLSDVQVSEEPGRQTFLGGHVTRWNMTGSQTRGPRIMAWTALWTYDDVAELYAGYTYTDLTDGRRYVDWMAKPDEAQLAGFSTTSGGSNA